jgi:hypothetical protein
MEQTFAEISAADAITAQRISEAQFRTLLKRHFGDLTERDFDLPDFIAEHLRAFSTDYQEAGWHYYVLSNDGFYIAPDSAAPLRITTTGTAEMSGDAAGILSCLFVLEGMAVIDPKLVHHHQRLQGFADQHTEATLIRTVLDPSAASEETSSEVTP